MNSYDDILKEIEDTIYNSRKKYNTFDVVGDYVVGHTENGDFLFDLDDLERLKNINKYWKINNSNYVLCYINDKEYQLHRYIMRLGRYSRKEDIIVDHINGNRLDNRKQNLRVTHRKNNPKNCKTYSNNTSGVKGISWNRDRQKWHVSIQVNKKPIYLGLYSDIEEAKAVREEAEIKYFKEFRRG